MQVGDRAEVIQDVFNVLICQAGLTLLPLGNFLVFQHQRYRQVDPEFRGNSDQREQLEGCSTTGTEGGSQDTCVQDNLQRIWHGITYNTIIGRRQSLANHNPHYRLDRVSQSAYLPTTRIENEPGSI